MHRRNSLHRVRMRKKRRVLRGISLGAKFMVVLIVLFFFIMMLVSRIQGTARVVNYAGLVRGETQRIIKLEGAGLPQDGMIEDVAPFAAFAARLNSSRFRPTRIFRSIMISAFRCPSRSMKSRSKNKLPPNA